MTVEEIIINGKRYKKTTPSEGKILHKIGTDEYYDEAIDLIDSSFEYEEVDEEE